MNADLKFSARQKPSFAERFQTDINGDCALVLPKSSGADAADAGVLSCCLLDPACVDAVVVKAGAGGEIFSDLRHRSVWESIHRLRERMAPVNLITVQDELKKSGLLDRVGGITWLSALQDTAPSSANLDHYLNMVCEKFLLRKLMLTCAGIAGGINEWTGEFSELLDAAEREVLAVRQTFERGQRVSNIEEIQQGLIQMYEDSINGRKPHGITTGFQDLDTKLGPAMPQEMIVVGGTPSSGKTTLALNIAINAAIAGHTVSIKSMETSASKIIHRVHCAVGKVDSGGFLNGCSTAQDMQKMVVACGKVRELRHRLMVSDLNQTDAQLMASCRQDYQKGARLFVVDMLQLIQTGIKDPTAAVGAASKCVKRIAKELNVPVIVTSALSRMEKDSSRRPTMHDLRQSGEIESDADKIVLLHCPDRNPDVRSVGVIVAKNKDGPVGDDLKMTFFSSQFRFESQSAIGDADVPRHEPSPSQFPD